MNRNRIQPLAYMSVVAILSLAIVGGCPTTSEPIPTAYTIAYKAFTCLLQETGEFLLQTAGTLRKAGVVMLPYEQTPTDTPGSAALSIQSGHVRALPLSDAGKASTQQSVTGTATVDVYISGPESANPCEDGVYVGAFELTFSNGSVTIANSSLNIPATALGDVVAGDFGICFETTTSVGVELIIEQIVVTFGAAGGSDPNQAPPGNDPNDDEPNNGTPNGQTPAGFKLASISHRGIQELLVGPSEYVDPTVGFFLEHPFNVGGFALSGNGERVWFWTYWHWSGTAPSDWLRIYRMNIDGSDLQRTNIGLEDGQRGWAIATNYDGSEAVFELGVIMDPGTFSERGGSRFFYCTPGGSATEMYDTVDSPPEGSGGRGLRLNDDASRFFWADASNLWAMDVLQTSEPTQLCTVDHLNFYGPWDPVTGGEFLYFDINASGSSWMINTRFWDADTQTSRWELASGAGELPATTQGITLARSGMLASEFFLTDDGSTVAYTSQQGGNWCYVQGPDGTLDLATTGPTRTGSTEALCLSDDGKKAWCTYVSDGSVDGTNYSSVLYDLEANARRLIGTNYFYGSLGGRQMSDNGGVLAAIFSCCRSEPLKHVWVCRPATGAPTGFPQITDVYYRFDSASDALIVQVKATSANGLDRLYTLTHTNNVMPNGFYTAAESPLHGESENFVAVEGETDTYERTIYLNGKKGLLNGSQYLRIIAADGKKSRVTYLDFAPLP